jgi:hypothetical protein
MIETSRDGIQILRALALAIRSEQDYLLIPEALAVVGALKPQGALPSDAVDVKHATGYTYMLKTKGYTPLRLREALNKIAHADPRSADFYVGPMDRAHELLLYGTNRGQAWFAAISLLHLIRAVQSLPNAPAASP